MAAIIGEAERDPLAAAPALTQERCGAIARAAAQAGAAAAARRPRGRGGRQGQGAGLRPGTAAQTRCGWTASAAPQPWVLVSDEFRMKETTRMTWVPRVGFEPTLHGF